MVKMVKSGENYQAKKSSIEMQMVISKIPKIERKISLGTDNSNRYRFL